MAIAIRMARTTWEGPLASGTGTVRMGSGAAGELVVTWASRTERADGKTSPEELTAAAHSACYAMALALGSASTRLSWNGWPSPPPSPLTRQAVSRPSSHHIST